MKFLKVRKVENPSRRYGDAGIDFYVPENTESFYKDLYEKNRESIDLGYIEINDSIIIKEGGSVIIPSGIKSKFSPNIALMAVNKSGVCTKQRLSVGACLIDSTYQGEIHIHLINHSKDPTEIKFGQKIVQFVPFEIDNSAFSVEDINDIDENVFFNEKTERGQGGFGSTGI